MTNRITTRERLFNKLRKGPVRITFRKADGTKRVIDASLEDEYIAEFRKPTVNQLKLEAGARTLRVFSLEDNEFRSVTIRNVLKLEELQYAA